jgi:3-methyl-2-oxobutanoate hydroxymethyltransferase
LHVPPVAKSGYNLFMSSTPPRRFTLSDLRQARTTGRKVPMLTCYDFSTARLMQRAGIPMLLVGDSAANVILGHESTLPITLDFLIELTAAVRRGAPLSLVVGDLPFGSYGMDVARGFESATRMVKLSGCDCVKLEAGESHLPLITELADNGVAVMAHLGLKPQSVNVLGGYKFQGRTAAEARSIVDLAVRMEGAGATAILLEAVPPEVSAEVVRKTGVPVIGCGAGPACHGHVVVTHDLLGLTDQAPKFVPRLADLSSPLQASFERYARQVNGGEYPAAEHTYAMPAEEKAKFARE